MSKTEECPFCTAKHTRVSADTKLIRCTTCGKHFTVNQKKVSQQSMQYEYYVACQNCREPLAIRSVLGKVYIWKYNRRGFATFDAMQTECPKCKTSILTRLKKKKQCNYCLKLADDTVKGQTQNRDRTWNIKVMNICKQCRVTLLDFFRPIKGAL